VTAPGVHAFSVPPDHARLTIIVDLRAEPIAGILRGDDGDDGDDGHGEPFAGWMELTRAIERGLHAARQATGASPSPPGPSVPGPDAQGKN
jgi:hypothetical protein